MSKVYFITISLPLNRKAVIAHLTEKKLITDWFYNLPCSFFARSENSATEISSAINSHFGKQRHFVVATDNDRQGVLPVKHWERIKNAP